jgi:hypothetical protein
MPFSPVVPQVSGKVDVQGGFYQLSFIPTNELGHIL